MLTTLDELLWRDDDRIEHLQEVAPELSARTISVIDACLHSSGTRPIHLNLRISLPHHWAGPGSTETVFGGFLAALMEA
jgi:hypothetical protein